MTMNIKYRALKAFLLAVETGSFTHAAERLGVTQPSFTALIKDLEAILGLKLFERTTRSISLTSAGEEFALRVERPVADLEEAYHSMSDLSALRRGGAVLGALPSAALSLLPETLGRLRRRNPAVRVRIVEAHNDDLISMVRTNQIEFAVATLARQAPQFSFTPLVADCFTVVAPPDHPIARHDTITWRDLQPLDLIFLSRGSSARAVFERAFGREEGPPGLRYDVTNMATAVLLVREGLGIALLPRLALDALSVGDLFSRPIAEPTAHRLIGIVHRRDRHVSPAAQAVHDELGVVAREIAARFGWSAPEGMA